MKVICYCYWYFRSMRTTSTVKFSFGSGHFFLLRYSQSTSSVDIKVVRANLHKLGEIGLSPVDLVDNTHTWPL